MPRPLADSTGARISADSISRGTALPESRTRRAMLLSQSRETCTRVARLAQLLLAQLRHVELAEQLAEQVQVPEQRRAQAVARVDAQRNGAVLEVDGMRCARAFFAARLGGFPAHAGHRRQAREAAERLDEKAFRARFALQQLGEEMQPLLHRQADGEQIAHEEP